MYTSVALNYDGIFSVWQAFGGAQNNLTVNQITTATVGGYADAITAINATNLLAQNNDVLIIENYYNYVAVTLLQITNMQYLLQAFYSAGKSVLFGGRSLYDQSAALSHLRNDYFAGGASNFKLYIYQTIYGSSVTTQTWGFTNDSSDTPISIPQIFPVGTNALRNQYQVDSLNSTANLPINPYNIGAIYYSDAILSNQEYFNVYRSNSNGSRVMQIATEFHNWFNTANATTWVSPFLMQQYLVQCLLWLGKQEQQVIITPSYQQIDQNSQINLIFNFK